MPLELKDVDVETRKQQGRDAAKETEATEPKEYGQTSEENFPYTYFWIVGYNEQVEANTG